jgi:hypothetical protein
MKARTIPPTPASVIAQIAGLPELPMDALKALWRRLFGTDNPTYNRQFLERRIAYMLQEVELRKVDPSLLEHNQRRIDALLDPSKVSKAERSPALLPGSVLTREYQGIEHRVAVAQDGQYEFQGRRYPSLSMIAREITGTRWSGPLFFGVKVPAGAKAKAHRRPGARR